MSSLYAFVFVEDAERNEQQLIASAGQSPTEFRRLEERLNRTALRAASNIRSRRACLSKRRHTLDFSFEARPPLAISYARPRYPEPFESSALGLRSIRGQFGLHANVEGARYPPSLVHGHVNSAAGREDEEANLRAEYFRKTERRRRYD